jgi:hypothetical protein
MHMKTLRNLIAIFAIFAVASAACSRNPAGPDATKLPAIGSGTGT